MARAVVSGRPVVSAPSQRPPVAVSGSSTPWILRAGALVASVAVVGLWIALEVAHAWRRLRAWMD